MDFIGRCAESAGMPLSDPAVQVDQRGLQHLVLVDHRRSIVARFPRSSAGCRQIREGAARLRALRSWGLPVPQVLGVCDRGGPGVAHLVLSFVPGVPLDTVATDLLPVPARTRLVAQLISVTEAIHRMPVARWPSPAPDWVELWMGLLARIETCSDLPPRLRAEQSDLAHAAVSVARRARIGVFHGDLGGVNCRVDPSSGDVLGVLDWDSATVGDVATDLVAILHGVGPATAEQLRAADQRWAAAWQDYCAYSATWPVQAYLWSLRDGGPADRAAALQQLHRPPSTAPVR